ncbi:heat shock protein Hsp18 [Clostridium luticellarii]|jgi:HSP20 family protein|uniref:18 kDa heat shock protein n=1 Tax=Clostridium luticellarii TaxID=1691940 RepID=A0A2T0BP80_9CLOT|nr:heat shock protein Hsp18 [Clostridium luticellarii]PRR85688.1 18 kDa heat shock protein [Clostridium luticellarii]
MFDMIPFRKDNSMSRGDEFEKFMKSFFNNDFSPVGMNVFGRDFKVDLKENDDSYLVEADLPGVNKDDINLSFKNNYLTISAKRENSREDKKEDFVRRERNYGEFKRSFYIDNVDDQKIDASFKDGVLKIELAKSEKGRNRGRKIDIN